MNMQISEGLSQESHEGLLRMRLETALGDASTGTGTLLAQVLYDLYQSEARQLGRHDTCSKWLALDGSELATIAKQFMLSISPRWVPDHILPGGMKMISFITGAVYVGSEILGLNVDSPGLHPFANLPQRPGGSNLARLLRRIDYETQDLPCRKVGMLTYTERYDANHPRCLLQSPPCADAGGAVFQRTINFDSWGELFCAFSAYRIFRLARDIVRDMSVFWERRQALSSLAIDLRKTAERAVVKVENVAVRAVTLETAGPMSDPNGTWAVEFETWDHTLRRGVVAQEAILSDDLANGFDVADLDYATQVSDLRALGADGRIHGIARSVILAAPQGPGPILKELAERFETFVTLSSASQPFEFRLFWRYGAISVNDWLGHELDVTDHEVRLKGRSIPEQVAASLVGMPLQAVFDKPFQCETAIKSIAERHGDLCINLEQDIWLVNCTTGKIWKPG